jgi:hypothetical protein
MGKPRIRLSLPARGYVRQWLRCKTCSAVFFQDYIPYSLSNPITWLPCGHTPLGQRDLGARTIPESEAMPVHIEQRARALLAEGARA